MFSKKSDEWATPRDLFDKLDDMFHFTLDPCATDENHLCKKYYTIKDDGLKQDWSKDTAFVNPPYSKVKLWIKKSCESAKEGGCVVCLIPSRTDTIMWHEYVMKYATRVYFVKGRLKFGNSDNTAPFPSAIILFDKNGRVAIPRFETWLLE